MSEPEPKPCANCGRPRNEHWLVNFTDGPQHVSTPVLICPRNVYVPEK